MNVEIINIGDELLIGQVVNTNSAYMSKVLNDAGIEVKYVTVIGDNPDMIKESIVTALQRTDGVLITGGLGPTKDDMTKNCLNEMFGGTMVKNTQVDQHLQKYFLSRNLPYTSTNQSQALVPDCCQVIFNNVGTAPGMVFNSKSLNQSVISVAEAEDKGKLIISMPGVPFEMKEMMQRVTEILQKHYSVEAVVHKTLSVGGIGESFLSDKLEEFERRMAEINANDKSVCFKLAYLPDAGIIKLRLSAYGKENKKTEEKAEELFNSLKLILEDYLIACGEDNIAYVIGEELKSRHQTVATAESCTGGNIAHVITSNPGASSYFKGSVVSYCNEIKSIVLNVKKETLDIYGAVSADTAKQMATGALQLLNTDYAVAATGLAGPDTDGSDNETGTVYIAIAQKNKDVTVFKNCYKTTRQNFIDRTTHFALFELLKIIRKN
ncbi:MAG: CinA family nicotinamide mononucleotide deamidase-related protein [Bacteroidales bacterium]|nr:CinA family nicotinamide mononucleotide deamidase-related protein [Bacteroidales bacterium]